MSKISRSSKAGFTLLEISVVLLIMSAVIGAGFSILTSENQQERIEITRANLDKIEAALISFRIANNRLPCPADGSMNPTNADYGKEAGAETDNIPTNVTPNCVGGVPAANFSEAYDPNEVDPNLVVTTPATSVVGGMVPLIALGLNESDVLDGWGNKITYHVDAKATLTDAFSIYSLSADRCFNITVDDAISSLGGGPDRNLHMKHAIYALVSHGQDGHGAFSVGGPRLNTQSPDAGTYSQFQNANADFTEAGVAYAGDNLVNGTPYAYDMIFYDVPQAENPANSRDRFDDYLRYKSRSQLRSVQDGPGHFYPDFVVTSGGSVTDLDRVQYYYRCNKQFRKEADWISNDTGGYYMQVFGISISPNNKRIVAGLSNGVVTVHNYDGKMATQVPLTITPGTTPLSDVYWLSNSSFLAARTDAAVYSATRNQVMVFAEDSNNANSFTLVTNPFAIPSAPETDLPTTAGARVSVSPDRGEVLFTSTAAATPVMYSRNDDGTFTHILGAVNKRLATASYAGPYGAFWPTNMAYMAIPTTAGNRFVLFRSEGNHIYNEIAPPASLPGYAVTKIAFSPDARYMIAIGASSAWRVYSRANDTFTLLGADHPGNLPGTPVDIAFSADGRFVAVILNSLTLLPDGTQNNVVVYERTGNTFTLLESPNGATGYVRSANRILWRNLMPWEREIQ